MDDFGPLQVVLTVLVGIPMAIAFIWFIVWAIRKQTRMFLGTFGHTKCYILLEQKEGEKTVQQAKSNSEKEWDVLFKKGFPRREGGYEE